MYRRICKLKSTFQYNSFTKKKRQQNKIVQIEEFNILTTKNDILQFVTDPLQGNGEKFSVFRDIQNNSLKVPQCDS